ncbi:hypothetical protein CKAH01_04953 [Colletotrichum kahawae]|uniref:C2H2-type domain-containing protein n=1 Tax=Colletotrichum kahawae TaxID=34407 RepID=A0AAD9YEX1_COLKA|nr:hypothetical protein CKAH01_04953 [Colletotrichum kahawae]
MDSRVHAAFMERVSNVTFEECIRGSREEASAAGSASERAIIWQQRGMELNNEVTRQQRAIASEMSHNTQRAIPAARQAQGGHSILASTAALAPAPALTAASNTINSNLRVAQISANASALLAAIPAHLQAEAAASCAAHLANLDTKAAAASAEAAKSPADSDLSSKAKVATERVKRAHQRAKLSTKVCVHCHDKYSFNDTLRRHLKDIHYKTLEPYRSLSRADQNVVAAAEAP